MNRNKPRNLALDIIEKTIQISINFALVPSPEHDLTCSIYIVQLD